MQWVCRIAMFLVFSGILLELIADTRYYKFAKWVAGAILLLQCLSPLTETESIRNRLASLFASFDYALGTEKALEEIYGAEEQRSESVLDSYKETMASQIDRMLSKDGLRLLTADMEVAEDGTLLSLHVWAGYIDQPENSGILIPTVAPVVIKEEPKKEVVSPMELYIREVLAEFYQLEENKIEVVIQEAD